MVFQRAGQLPLAEDLVDVDKLLEAYSANQPDPSDPNQRVHFGTSGHRGSSFKNSFNEAHVVAMTEALVEYRQKAKIQGPIFIGFDTHPLSVPAARTAFEVLVAHDVTVFYDSNRSYTPTPAVSHAILRYNRPKSGSPFPTNGKVADGIVITPSHNPPTDGGFKYNPPNGGPADETVTSWIERRANQILEQGWAEVPLVPFEKAIETENCLKYDFKRTYIEELQNVVDLELIRKSGVKVATDTLGGAVLYYWPEIIDYYKLDWEVIHPDLDPTFAFLTLDWDGKIRMDCSSPYAMAGLNRYLEQNPQFDLATGNDGDSDRHGIVTKSGLMNPNHYLAVAIDYLFQNRPNWPVKAGVGKTLVSSSLITRVADGIRRECIEVPVGFKWFVSGLLDSSLGFGGEESAGASFLRKNGLVWTTDKDGPIMCLLAAEIMAKTGKSPSEYHQDLVDKYGDSWYKRIDAPATREQKIQLAKLSASDVTHSDLAGEPIVAKLTEAPGNHAPIGGLKVVTSDAWFAARPSGTEDLYKLYAESFKSEQHLQEVLDAAQTLVSSAILS
ncbi:MAG: phosphoglucomutase (alpha-D-glucose-1,6-bisphosphate-dependent) [Bifidobacteriaceae bacterium]|jgi:phosphoglucomutase|nr:phosphoglucomutase (alpha-D-glucose-1,6-bisphosphate-dependent) [Bifidobacteriaceae bacterium]